VFINAISTKTGTHKTSLVLYYCHMHLWLLKQNEVHKINFWDLPVTINYSSNLGCQLSLPVIKSQEKLTIQKSFEFLQIWNYVTNISDFWLWGFCMVCKVNLLTNQNKYSYSDSRPVKMGPTAVSKTSSVNSHRTPCINPKTKKQYSPHGECLKSRKISDW
jgi:hypothetical protein